MYLELFLETLPGTDRDHLVELLRAKGFDPLPMKEGLLLAGKVEALSKLLPGLVGPETGELPVPEELKNAIRSISIFKPRSLF
jgi:hypothetical protein